MSDFLDFIFGYEEIKIEDKYAYLREAETISPAEYYNAYLYDYIIHAKLFLNKNINDLSSKIGYWRASAVCKFNDVPNEEYIYLYVPEVPKDAYNLDDLFSSLIDKYYGEDYDELYYEVLQKRALPRLYGLTYENRSEFARLVKKEEEIEFALRQYERQWDD